jgi:hypothetical protein
MLQYNTVQNVCSNGTVGDFGRPVNPRERTTSTRPNETAIFAYITQETSRDKNVIYFWETEIQI